MNAMCENCDRECRHSFVYIMGGREDGALKVGYAKDAKKRAAQLRRDVDPRIVLVERFRVRCEFVAMDAEDAAHNALAEYWTGRGEWFTCSEQVAREAILAAIARAS